MGRWIGFGYTKSFRIDLDEAEVYNNRMLVTNAVPYFLKGHNPTPGTLVVSIPQGTKYRRRYEFLTDLVKYVVKKGYQVTVVGEGGIVFDNYKKLYEFLCTQEFFIGGDCGVMHFADILGIPGVVIWGDTKGKNKPMNNLKVINGLQTPAEIVYEIFLSLQAKKSIKKR
jgi:hypothetical protein